MNQRLKKFFLFEALEILFIYKDEDIIIKKENGKNRKLIIIKYKLMAKLVLMTSNLKIAEKETKYI